LHPGLLHFGFVSQMRLRVLVSIPDIEREECSR